MFLIVLQWSYVTTIGIDLLCFEIYITTDSKEFFYNYWHNDLALALEFTKVLRCKHLGIQVKPENILYS